MAEHPFLPLYLKKLGQEQQQAVKVSVKERVATNEVN